MEQQRSRELVDGNVALYEIIGRYLEVFRGCVSKEAIGLCSIISGIALGRCDKYAD